MEKIYINLTKNPDWKSPADKVPVYIGPKNMKHPDKNWTVGVNVNGQWYNQAAFPSKDPDGNLKEGELTIILTPSGAGKSTNNSFASEPKDANNEYTF
jgi:hypothetical protein|tara:strand:- start:166 stop:459 length:294 start_codon:yes stop_codon:yes gene_type:complete